MKNNIKLLTNEERRNFNIKYDFAIIDNYIMVRTHLFDRVTPHLITDSFCISFEKRKLTIEPQAIQLWMKYFKDDYSLIDVQTALNHLVLMYQNPDVSSVESVLKKL